MSIVQTIACQGKILRAVEKLLGPDLNFGSHRNQLPYFINLCIRHGDAAIRPIGLAVQRPQIGKRPGQSMNHNCAAGPRTDTARSFLVCCTGIRNVQRQMELAMRIFCVDSVVALRRLVVAFNSLRANWDRSQSYFVRFEGSSAAQQRHGTSRFYDDDSVGLNGGGGRSAM